MYVFDVWAGKHHQDHIARQIFSEDRWTELCLQQKKELKQGYLTNVRVDLAWGPDKSFDCRHGDLPR